MAKQINARIINKSGFESEWINATTFIPKNAELIVYRAEIDQNGNLITLEDGKTASLPEGRTEFYSYARFKIGDGVTPVNDLPFTKGEAAEAAAVEWANVQNKPEVNPGTGTSSLVLMEGSANGAYSVAAGTDDTSVLGDLSTIAGSIDINLPEANGAMSLALGASAKTESVGAMSLGVGNQAGIKGYYWWDIDLDAKTISLSNGRQSITNWNRDIPSSLDWAVGDVVSIVNDKKYPYCATIMAVSDDAVITVDNLPFTEISSLATMPDDKTIFAIYRTTEEILGIETTKITARTGSVELGWGAQAFGAMNLAAGTFSQTFGWSNIQAGDFGFVTGRDNIGGYASATFGAGNKNIAQNAFASGSDNINTGANNLIGGLKNKVYTANSVANGYNNTINASSSGTIVAGEGNNITTAYNAVFGKNNTVTANSNLIGGTGNTSTGAYAFIGGSSNTSNNSGNIMAGNGNTANGNDSGIFGQGNTSSGSQTFICALNSTIATNCGESAIFGNNNIIGSDTEVTLPDGTSTTKTGLTNSFVAGKNNKMYAANAFMAGQSNTVWNGNSAVFGYNNSVQGASNLVCGDGNISNTWCQTVLGKYNDNTVTNGDLFVIGNGSSSTRSNALRVTAGGAMITAGKITAGADPVNDMDVVTKQYFEANAAGSGLPDVSTDDNGSFLRVVDGVWEIVNFNVYDGSVV